MRWCNNCENFIANRIDKNTNIDTCSKRHQPEMKYPESPNDQKWGHYKTKCSDFISYVKPIKTTLTKNSNPWQAKR